MKRIHTLLTLILLLMAVPLVQAASISLQPGFRQQNLAGVLAYLEDKDGTLALADLLQDDARFAWHISEQPILNFGFTDAVYWARFDVESPSTPQEQDLFLEISYPLLDDIRVYLLQDGTLLREFHVGASLPFAERLVRHGNFLIPLDVSPQPLQVVLRVQSQSSMQIPLLLWEKDAFVEHVYAESTGYGFFYGTILIIALYNLLVFLTARGVGFVYIFFYSVGVVMIEAGLRGAAFAFVWPEATTWTDRSILIGIMGCTLFGNLFVDQVLLVRQTWPRLARVLRTLALLSALNMVLTFLLPYKQMILLCLLLVAISSPTTLTALVLRSRQGYTPALYTLVGAMVFILSAFVMIFSKLGWLPRNPVTENLVYFGAVFQLLLFSLSLADRMNVDRQLREEAQLKAAASQKELLDVQLKINEDLDRRVRERTDELEAVNTKLQELSTTDSLTGLRNRRYFDDMLLNEYKRAFRDKLPLSVLLLDIDHFKSLNDNYGHPFGDLCLVEAAGLIRDCIKRPPDVAARYGGEEFVVLLPQTDREGAVQVAECLRAAFNVKRIEDGPHSVVMTISIGVSSTVPPDRDGHEKLLKRADELLYRAKQNGRNRVEWESDSA
ncbi:MAG: GGDEF domain-containing protein [Gammaproteobacteria bacterium]|nr:GGDEF domain-containing protein [Gammaproteobacteria bacterium]